MPTPVVHGLWQELARPEGLGKLFGASFGPQSLTAERGSGVHQQQE